MTKQRSNQIFFLEKIWGGLLLTNQGKDPESENYNCEYIGLSNFVKQLLQIYNYRLTPTQEFGWLQYPTLTVKQIHSTKN